MLDFFQLVEHRVLLWLIPSIISILPVLVLPAEVVCLIAVQHSLGQSGWGCSSEGDEWDKFLNM